MGLKVLLSPQSLLNVTQPTSCRRLMDSISERESVCDFMSIYIYVYTCIHNIYIYVSYRYTYRCVYIYMYVCTYTHVCAYMSVYVEFRALQTMGSSTFRLSTCFPGYHTLSSALSLIRRIEALTCLKLMVPKLKPSEF